MIWSVRANRSQRVLREATESRVFLLLVAVLLPTSLWGAEPVVDSFTASTSTVAPGGLVDLAVAARDPDCAGTCTSGCGQTLRADLTVWNATGGTFTSEDNGVTASPYTASAQWQAPATEDSYTITVSLSDSGTFMCGGRGTVTANLTILVTTSTNQPPTVESVVAAPSQLFPGQSSDLTCLATDPEGDPLTFSWSADAGTVAPGSGSNATFEASEPGVATVTCTATDTQGATGSGSTGVSVTDAVPEARFSEHVGTPQRVAFDSLGDVYVVDRAGGGLTALSVLDGELVYRLSLPGARSVAVDWQDRLLVGDALGARVVDRDGQLVRALDPGAPLGDVADVAVDLVRQRYAVLHHSAARVMVYDALGTPIGAFGSTGDAPEQLKRPRGLAVNPAGQIVVGDSGHGRIKVFELDGTLALDFAGAGGGAGEFVQLDDVAVGANGVVYASDAYQDWVQSFNPDGTPREVLGTYGDGLGRFMTPTGVAVSEAYRRLVVASLNSSSLQVFRLGDDPPSPPSAGASLSTDSLAFALQAVGTVSDPQAVVLTNPGGAPLGIHGVDVAGDFSQTNDCGPFVDPGSSCTLSLTFAPRSPGSRAGSLTLETNDAPAVVALTGEAFIPAGAGVSPGFVSFGDQPVGTVSDPEAVTLANLGTVPLLISDVRVSSGFGLVNGCGSSLAGASSCVLDVYFAPQVVGDEILGTLTIETSAGSPQTVPLEGRGVLFDLTATPEAVDLGRVLVDEVSPAQTVTVTNSGSDFALIGPATLEGDRPDLFVVQEDLCSGARLEAGETCHLAVAFGPTERGAYSASLRIPSNAGDSPDQVALAGSAHVPGETELIFADDFESGDLSAWSTVEPPVLEISASGPGTPVVLDFGEVPLGESSGPLTVTIDKAGDTSLSLGPAALGGSQPQDFRIWTDTCSRDRFGRSATCLVQVVFTPATDEVSTAELLIQSRTGEVLAAAELTGVGGAPAVGGP